VNTIIQPYKAGSKSAKALAGAIGCKRIAIKRSTYRHRRGRKVINWGSQRLYPGIPEQDYINNPRAVALASNKLLTLQKLTEHAVPTLGFTTDRQEAQDKLDAMDVHSIYCRHLLSANSGRGIEVIKHGQEVPETPLYTYGLYKWTEWRIHCGLSRYGMEKIKVQQKIKRGMSRRNPGEDDIRNCDADYTFRVQDLTIPDEEGFYRTAEEALKALGLHFGGIDMAHTREGWKVIEVNTACGLAGESTAQKYKEYFRGVVQ